MLSDVQTTPRPEHPRPQFFRPNWFSLNGVWTFSYDFGRSGREKGYVLSEGFDRTITVPFCPESRLSGVHYRDFLERIWYHRTFQLPDHWNGKTILLHFGAVDYETEVYIDGQLAGRHWGGSSSFTCDITALTEPGETHHLVVHAIDELRSGAQTGGKQSPEFMSAGCLYSRVTGIWQPVWLEAVAPIHLESVHILSSFKGRCACISPRLRNQPSHCLFRATISKEGRQIAREQVRLTNNMPIYLPVADPEPWHPDNPALYDLELEILAEDGQKIDRVTSYTGLRDVSVNGRDILLNDEPIYLRFVLDQGYYSEGIWTAPHDDALRRDIALAKAAGFNGARLHQKVFEERFHYWADRLGYLTWAESPSWGLDLRGDLAARNYLSEWREVVMRDRNHPSIIAWTTLNETWDISNRRQHTRLHLESYALTRDLDSSRPVNGSSGGCQVKTDLYTVHIYEQDPDLLYQKLAPTPEHGVYRTLGDKEIEYEGQPYLVDEFGGVRWVEDPAKQENLSWGYGKDPISVEDFINRIDGQVRAILAHPHISGYCYTQLTDVEQEQNGLYYYDRMPKVPEDVLQRIFSRTPAMPEIMGTKT